MDLHAVIERLAPGARVTECRALAGGVSAEVTAVTFTRPDGGEDCVVARRHREIAGKADRGARAAREHALLTALHARGLPVPGSRLFVAPDTLVIDFIAGDSALPAGAAAHLAAVLAAIHATPVAGLPELPTRDDPLPELRTWLPGLPALEDHAAGEAATALRMDEPPAQGGLSLSDRRGPRAARSLLHGDFWPGNVLWQSGEPVAVLDWEDAAIGDPLSDLACARVELACSAGPALAEKFTREYCRLTGCDLGRLPIWDLYVATAALQYMDHWGLEPRALLERRATTAAWQADALARLQATG
jgi:aminoglycoside phosphotransferase (APT) family kinase protein